jgi:hypothetical protein
VLHQKWEQMRTLILVLRNNKIHKLVTGLNTCMVENSNRRRLKYTPKTHFFQASYKARSLISATVESAGKLETARWLANTLGVGVDLETVKLFGDTNNRARRHRQRKTSFEYTARKKRTRLQRVQRKPAEQAADAERRMEQRYLTLAQKLIETKQPGQRRKRATQQELKAAYMSKSGSPQREVVCAVRLVLSPVSCLRARQTFAGRERARRAHID